MGVGFVEPLSRPTDCANHGHPVTVVSSIRS